MEQKKLPKTALGAWAWGNDGTFGGEGNEINGAGEEVFL